MRLAIVAVVLPILLLAALLLALGVMSVVSGLRGGGESPHLYLTVGIIVTSLGLVLASVGGTLAFFGTRGRKASAPIR